MEISYQAIAPTIMVVRVNGAVNARSAEHFKQCMRWLVSEQGATEIIVELQSVPFVDSSGLAGLVSGLQVVGDTRRFLLTAPQSQVRLLAELTMFDRVFRIYDSTQEALEALTIEYLHKIGQSFQVQGVLDQAQVCYEQTLRFEEKVYGPKHEDITSTLHKLGLLLQARGDIDGARVHLKRASVIREQRYGPDDEQTLASREALENLKQVPGDTPPRLAQELTPRKNVSNEILFSQATSWDTLGHLLWYHGDSSGARVAFEQALAIRERLVGAIHPNTIRTRKALAEIEMGKTVQRGQVQKFL